MNIPNRQPARRSVPAAALLLGALIAGAALPAAAQTTPAPSASAPSGPMARGGRGPQGRAEAPPARDWQRELGVSPEVAAKLDATLAAGRERIDQARDRLEQTREQNRRDVASLLTPEQMVRFERLHERHARMGGHHGGPGQGPDARR